MPERPRHNLRIWRSAKALALDIYELTNNFPDSEKFGLVSQLRRAANSVQSDIAEGTARSTDKDFRRFLYQARASLEEIDSQLELSGDLGYLENKNVKDTAEKFEDLSRGLAGLINHRTDENGDH
jgi:four helix bundle protein